MARPELSYYWPFRILSGKAILRIPLKKKRRERESLFYFRGHRWILRASGLVSSWFFQYNNNLDRRGKNGLKRGPVYFFAAAICTGSIVAVLRISRSFSVLVLHILALVQ